MLLAGWHPIYLDVSTSFDLERTVPKYSSYLLVCHKGSVLGPLFFIMYTVDLVELICSQNLQPHLYADDSQLYGSCQPGDALTLADRVTRCVDLVASWMRSNRLRLNSDMTEVIWVSTSRRQHPLSVGPMLIDGSLVHPVRTVRNLGVFIDADLVMRSHVTRVVAQYASLSCVSCGSSVDCCRLHR